MIKQSPQNKENNVAKKHKKIHAEVNKHLGNAAGARTGAAKLKR